MNPLFNVRVYGILIENESVLVSDEIHHGRMITKFPGGGLQFGEGTHDCLKREFLEELNISVQIISHFYTVDFFQPSAFDSTQQVISIYYVVRSEEISNIPVANTKLTLDNNEGVIQLFRWVEIGDLNESIFTFPIDKKVSELIAEKFSDYKK